MNKLLKPSDVASRLGIGRSKTYDLIKAGVLPSVRLGKRLVRVPESELDALIARLVIDAAP